MVRTCAYPGCTNKDESGSPQTFHRFPLTNVALRRLWLLSLGLNVELTQLPKMRKLRVCSDHFSEDDYLPEGQTKRRILKSTAVPAPQDKRDIMSSIHGSQISGLQEDCMSQQHRSSRKIWWRRSSNDGLTPM
ncbi:THAP domain-containing protein 1-like [Chelmon rostratus]|uniref:THAP domain-containing protein 1-like n=1 Tax=Chelmon rostratus TaxID=109905 RepID=UPI001BE7ED6F|nr:THAP domain-containing protein 1-like [Chelmon rostratus]XP_041819215.1 THAP domain-containing protein 1-like [Chelmon rostratus]